jgi:hypothetical protein
VAPGSRGGARRHAWLDRLEAKPNDTDGTIADEPASMKMASRHAASLATHLVFGLTVEAVRRLLAPRR